MSCTSRSPLAPAPLASASARLRYFCTREDGHDGAHIATDSLRRVLATWGPCGGCGTVTDHWVTMADQFVCDACSPFDRSAPIDDDGIKYMDIEEFRELGFLQEANRQFFHPLGLALEVVVDADGTWRLGGIQDYRDDPEGYLFASGGDADKQARVSAEYDRHRLVRQRLMGAVVQPIGYVPE